MGLATLSKRLLSRVRSRDPESNRQRRGIRLQVRSLERRIVLDATVAIGGGSVDLSNFLQGTTVTVTQDAFDIDGDTVADDVYRFSLGSGVWNDGVSNLSGGIDLDGVAGAEGFVNGGQLYVSAAFLETNAGGLSITTNGGTNLTIALATSVTTVGNQDYGGAVMLQSDVVVSAGAGNVTFGGSVDGPQALVVESSGVTTFQGLVQIGQLTTDAGGSTTLAPGASAIKTTASQTYGDDVTLGTGVTLTGTLIDFHGKVASSNFSLAIVGNAVLGDAADDHFTQLGFLSVTGATTIHTSLVESLSSQTYDGDVTLGGDVTLDGPAVTFNGKVLGTGDALAITGNAVFGNAAGDSVTGLSTLSVLGSTTINTATVTSSGTQTFGGDVTLGANLSLTGSLIDFQGNVHGAGRSLTLVGDVVFGNDPLDSATGMTLLSVTGDTTINGSSVSATTSMVFNGDISLGSNATLTAPQVKLHGDVTGGGHSLAIIGAAVIGDDAGDLLAGLTTLTVTGPTITLDAGSIESSGVQTYNGVVQLTSDVALTASQVIFTSSVIGAGHGLAITGNAVLGDTASDSVSGLSSLSISGTTSIVAATVDSSGSQTYGGGVTLGSDVVLTASLATFNGQVIGGHHALTINGPAIFGNDAADTVTGLAALHVNGATTIRTNTVSSSGAQTYGGDLTLGSDVTLTASLVDLQGDVFGGSHALAIVGDAILGSSAANSLTGLTALTISGDSTIHAGVVTTSGLQTYTGDVTLESSVALTASTATFLSDIIGNGHSLGISGKAVFGDSATDSVTGIATLAVTGTTLIDAGTISTTGGQTFEGDVTLASDATLTASLVTFNGKLIGAGHSLLVAGNAVFGDEAADSVTGLTTLAVAGTTVIKTHTVTTSGPQTYTGAATIGATAGLAVLTTTNSDVLFGSTLQLDSDLTVNAGAGHVTFIGAVDGPHDLVVNSTGTTAFNGSVGGNTALASVTTNAGGATQINGGGVQTTGDQRYGDDVQIGPGTQSLSGGVIHFFERVDGRLDRQGGLNITSADAVFFDKAIGSVRDPASVKVRAVDITFADGTFIEVGDSAAESVHIVATGTLVLPADFVVRAAYNGGDYDGVANTFLPRSAPGVLDTALVELPRDRPLFSTQQNLDQSATTTVELTIGNTGERGLRLFIDWGDTVSLENRFEGPDGWADGDGSGDNDDPGDLFAIEGGSTVQLTHTYTADEVRNQLLVDNTFDVTYAVFQHEAIVIEAARVEQAGETPLGTAGGPLNVLTTTMLFTSSAGTRAEPPAPSTIPDLVNGTVGVQIAPPSGSPPFEIPTERPPAAFAPITDAPPLAAAVTFQQVTQDESVSSSPIVGRQQRFVLRLLSPDPTAPPLAEVDLPADSFQDDRLQTLFRELPDGSYEIDLILGENTERPILRFDIRQGRPVVPQESLDGGQLRLEDIEETLRRHSEPAPPGASDSGSLERGEKATDAASAGTVESEEVVADSAESETNSSRPTRAAGTMGSRLEWQLRRRAADIDGSLTLASRLARRLRS